MEIDEVRRVLPFQLQFDKPVPSQIKIAEWNPEKDLLAMVTEDSKIVLHRFNWQRLWMITPGRCTTSLCWRPDGKAIAIGLEDGTVSLHDVENGKLLRSIKSHNAAVVCLNWEEGGQQIGTELGSTSSYEDRTSRFFPPAPRVPRMPGLIPGDAGFTDDCEDSFRELSNSSYQHFNVLCSGDEEGSICFSIFGIFPIGKINIHNFCISTQHEDQARVQNASISKVIFSKDLCHLTVICRGELVQDKAEPIDKRMITDALFGLHCLVLDTSIFWKRKHELHQVAVQASNIEDLTEVIRASLSIMCKQWSDAMRAFHEKFSCLSALISDHGLDSSPQEEFLSLLGGARTSPPVHQFLVSSLGEVGIKRVSKVVYNAGRELQLIILDHLQPAAEIIGFRMGELRGFSRWRARYQSIGLDEALINDATEKAGLFLVQVERFMGVLSSVVPQFSNFFNWLIKCTKLLMSEAGDHLPPFSSELVVIFLKFLYDQDPVKQLLDPSEVDCRIEVDVETMQRVRELVLFGGFRDSDYLKRTLVKEFQQMEFSFKEAFLMPFTTVKEKMVCKDLLPLFPLPLSLASAPGNILTSVSYYKDNSQAGAANGTSQHKFIDYISFKIPDEPFPDFKNCICVLRGFVHGLSIMNKGSTSLEAVVLRVPNNYHCVDLSLYKESQLVLLLNEIRTGPDSTGNACMMITQASEFPFVSVSSAIGQSHFWILHGIKDTSIYVQMENEKVRSIPHLVIAPLAVSASRGVVCVFAAKKRALVYILDEDEEEEEEEDTSDME